MKNTLIIIFFFLGLGVALAGHLPSSELLSAKPTADVAASSHLGIYDGHEISIKRHPYIVAVFSGILRCAGTIIDRSWVLISGDCAYKSTPEDLDLYAGSTNATSGTHYTIKKIVTHPKYDHSTFDHDFALLQIKGKFKWSKKINKIALPKKELKDSTRVVAAGWGNTMSKSQPTPLLQEGFMDVMSLGDCATVYTGFRVNFTDTMGCVYKHDLDKNTTLCDGDWSDPITRNKVIYYIFLGIAERYMCTSSALPSICGDVLSVVPWIKEVIQKEYDATITNIGNVNI